MRIALIAGTRPNFVKIASVRNALALRPIFETILVHTGQHYDEAMSESFFRELEIPEPDVNLDVGSASHAVQTGRIMDAFDGFLDGEEIGLVIVVGDVNSTLACSLTAVKRGIPVAHVEAGLRSFDWTMPEEINRIVTDAVSSFLFTPSRYGDENLAREGRPPESIFFVGNVMVDTLLRFREKANQTSRVLSKLGLSPHGYAVLTLHRPSNVDDRASLQGLLAALAEIAAEVPVVYPVHPRTKRSLEATGLLSDAESIGGLLMIGPLGYLDFIELESQARLVMTDSGGVQEETTVLGVPCLTLRPNTERPVTVTQGTNTVIGTDPETIVEAALGALEADVGAAGPLPELWDGKASERIADILAARFG
jgi:UDP-N-acetylglucosamine 2-epimerase (non-hydrolysing)